MSLSRLAPGRTLALVGATGAGKTTVISLLARFYDVTRGQIRYGGVDVRDLDLAAWRASLAPSAGTRTSSAARSPRTSGSVPKSRMSACARQPRARTRRLVHPDLPRLNETSHGRGATLSVGQKQLIAFARALAHDPRILVLDEATSSIDTETEALIQDALRVLRRGRSAIVIAHRSPRCRDADEILVFHRAASAGAADTTSSSRSVGSTGASTSSSIRTKRAQGTPLLWRALIPSSTR